MNKMDLVDKLMDLGYIVLLFPDDDEYFKKFNKKTKEKNTTPEDVLKKFIKRYIEGGK